MRKRFASSLRRRRHQPAPACVPVAVTLEVTGDSISTGSGATDVAFTPASLLRAAFPSISVVLTGQGGSTSSDRISGAPIPGHGQFQPFPLGSVGNLHLSNFGVNDAIQGVPLETYRANLRKIASLPGSILQTPTPIVGVSDAAYAQVVREVGAELGVPVADVQAYVLSLPNWEVLLVDGTHPGDALYRLIEANVVVPAVARQVATLQCR